MNKLLIALLLLASPVAALVLATKFKTHQANKFCSGINEGDGVAVVTEKAEELEARVWFSENGIGRGSVYSKSVTDMEVRFNIPVSTCYGYCRMHVRGNKVSEIGSGHLCN